MRYHAQQTLSTLLSVHGRLEFVKRNLFMQDLWPVLRFIAQTIACFPDEVSTSLPLAKKAFRHPPGLRLSGALLVSSLVALCSASSRAVLAQSASALSAAVEQLHAGHPEQAVATLDTALRADPRNLKAATLKGIILDQEARPQEALRTLNQALAIQPDYIPALQASAQIRYRTHDPQVNAVLQHLVDLQPGDKTAHAMLGSLAAQQRNCAIAVQDFRLAEAASSSDPILLQQDAACLADQKLYREALPILYKLLVLKPDDTERRYNLALAQFLTGDPSSAAATLAPLCTAQACPADLLGLAVDTAQASGQTPSAIALLQGAIRRAPDDRENYLRFASVANDNASFRAGITMLDLGLSRLPRAASLYLARGVLYSQLADYDRAIRDFAQANSLDPQLGLVSAARGVLESQQHHDDAAIETLRSSVRLHPNDALAPFLLAEALSETDFSQNRAEAIAAATRAITLDPTLLSARDLLTGLYLQQENLPLAQQQAELALRQDPTDQQAVYHLILALRRTNRKAEVPALAKRLAELREADANSHPRYSLSISSPE